MCPIKAASIPAATYAEPPVWMFFHSHTRVTRGVWRRRAKGAVTPGLSGNRGNCRWLELTNIPPGGKFRVCLIDFKRWTQLLISCFFFSYRQITSLDNHQQLLKVELCCLWQGLLSGMWVFEKLNDFIFFSASLLKSCKFVSRLFFEPHSVLVVVLAFLNAFCWHRSSRVGWFSIFTIYLLFFRFVGCRRVGIRMCGLKNPLLLSTCILNNDLRQTKRKHFLRILTLRERIRRTPCKGRAEWRDAGIKRAARAVQMFTPAFGGRRRDN